ncbi:MAG: hypothetical protein ACLVEU_00425 [Bacteroides cellulosilyticus]
MDSLPKPLIKQAQVDLQGVLQHWYRSVEDFIKESDIASGRCVYPLKIEYFKALEEVKLLVTFCRTSTLPERRPDVRQAEQKLIAANATVGLAYTNMFLKPGSDTLCFRRVLNFSDLKSLTIS